MGLCVWASVVKAKANVAAPLLPSFCQLSRRANGEGEAEGQSLRKNIVSLVLSS